MKVLFDHNVPHKLRKSLAEHQVATADEKQWSQLENGQLLRAAEDAGFDVMVSCDQNISYQQNLEGRKLALVILSLNDWNILKQSIGQVVEAIRAAKPGSFQLVTIPRPSIKEHQ